MNSRAIQQLTNDRIYSRNIPSSHLDNPISFRPVITKYTKIPDPLPKPYMDNSAPPFSISTTFNPGSRKSPWIGYKNAVDAESILRDQVTNIGEQKKYVPNVLGDLYHVSVSEDKPSVGITTFPYLFKNPTFNPFNPGEGITCEFTFYNSCRTNKPV